MSLINCKACDKEVSTQAENCPHCGQPIKKKPKQYGCGTVILLFVVGIILFSVYQSSTEPPPAPKTAEELRKERIEQGFSAWDGSHIQLTRWIKNNLKDPDSYEHISTRYVDQGDHLTVYTTYRAKNSFGGYVVNSVAAKAQYSGAIIEMIKSE